MQTQEFDLSILLQHEEQYYDNESLLLKKFFPRSITWVSRLINTIYHVHPTCAFRLTMLVLSVALPRKLDKTDLDFYGKGNKETLVCKNKVFHIYHYGSGPEVYLIHGWAASGSRWKTYVEILVQRGYKATIIDAPGHGTSPGLLLSIPDYIAVLQKVFNRSKNLHAVISHSIGSLCSIIALKQSLQVHNHRVALMSTFNSCQALLDKFARCIGIKEQIVVRLKEWIPKYAGNELDYYQINKHLTSLRCESLLIYDRQDIVVPSKETLEILTDNPNMKFYSTYGLGHNLNSEEVRGKVVDFIT